MRLQLSKFDFSGWFDQIIECKPLLLLWAAALQDVRVNASLLSVIHPFQIHTDS